MNASEMQGVASVVDNCRLVEVPKSGIAVEVSSLRPGLNFYVGLGRVLLSVYTPKPEPDLPPHYLIQVAEGGDLMREAYAGLWPDKTIRLGRNAGLRGRFGKALDTPGIAEKHASLLLGGGILTIFDTGGDTKIYLPPYGEYRNIRRI